MSRLRQSASPSLFASLFTGLYTQLIAPLRFALILIIPLSMLDAVRLGRFFEMPNFFAFWPLIVNFGLLNVIDYVVGKNTAQPPALLKQPVLYRWIALAALPVQALALWWGLHVFVTADFSLLGQIGWILSVGAISGTLAITAAHELIHKTSRLEQTVGGILLSSVCYGGFKIEHVYGHHVHVATPHDASSARYGQTVYHFLPRAIWHNCRNAWRLETARLRRQQRSLWQHEVFHWHLLSLSMAIAVFAVFGGAGVVFFLGQAVVAFCELEVINYVEHYGLERRLIHGRYERVSEAHSWNSSYRLMNWFLLNLARHADHHAHAARRYQELRHTDVAPQLPGGYAAMVVLALMPPLWFRAIHPRLPNRQPSPIADMSHVE